MNVKKNIKFTSISYILAIVTGLVTGAIAAIFGRVLLEITAFREVNYLYLIPFLAFAGLSIVYLYQVTGGNRGLGDVFKVSKEKDGKLPLRMIPLVIITTWTTHLFGASAGREGVSVQIGGVVGYNVGRVFKDKELAHILLIAGMAAGFSGLFQTPIAAVFFALEVLVVGTIKYYAIVPTVLASLSAYMSSRFMGLEQFRVNLTVSTDIDLAVIAKIMVLGILFGIAGKMFAEFLKYFKAKFSDFFESPYKKIFVISIAIAILTILIHGGRYSGLGTNIISFAFNNGEIYSYDWILKLLFTVITLAAGFQGGEVTPLFAIGASLGFIAAPFLGLPAILGGALGYAAVFSAATNSIIGPIFIGAEVFGFQYTPFFVVACTFAYVVSGNSTIYSNQQIYSSNFE